MPYSAQGLWYPVLGGSNNPPADFQAQNSTIEAAYGKAVSNWTALVALTGNFVGRRVWVNSIGAPAVWNGSKWLVPDFRPVVKEDDESISSNSSAQNDNDLSMLIPAAGTFLIDMYAIASSEANSAGDIFFNYQYSGVAHLGGAGLVPAIASGSLGSGEWKALTSASSGSNSISYGLSTSPVLIHQRIVLVASGSGTFQVRWAQRVSDAFDTTVHAGSHLTAKQAA